MLKKTFLYCFCEDEEEKDKWMSSIKPLNRSRTTVRRQKSVEISSHSRPIDDEISQVQKKQKVDDLHENGDDEMGFAFDDTNFSDHQLTVSAPEQETRVLRISKLILASNSVYFKSKILSDSTNTAVELDDTEKIEHFVDLIRWMYCKTFSSKGGELSEVMMLAYKFKVKKALEKCVAELSQEMSVSNACQYLEQESSMNKQFPNEEYFQGFSQLWQQSREYLRTTFKELNLATFTSQTFLALTPDGIKTVLESDELHIGTENTVFAALKQWLYVDFNTRKLHAADLLRCVKFQHLQKNYLLDVVRPEADQDYPEDARQVFAKEIIEAYVHHCTSQERLTSLNIKVTPQRNYDERLLQENFEWKIDEVSSKREVWSQPFFLGGYQLYLLMQRKNSKNPKGGTIGLYMHLKVKDAGLGQDFYIPLAFELLVKNKITGQYQSAKGAYASPFTFSNRAWGYVDILNLSWNDFLQPDCIYNNDDCLEVKATVWFKDIWIKQKELSQQYNTPRTGPMSK